MDTATADLTVPTASMGGDGEQLLMLLPPSTPAFDGVMRGVSLLFPDLPPYAVRERPDGWREVWVPDTMDACQIAWDVAALAGGVDRVGSGLAAAGAHHG